MNRAATGAERERTDVAIVGAGFAGLGLGIRMRRRGQRDFRILERAGDVGGTWRDNTYPGIACDVPSHLYSFSFRQEASWSRVYPRGAEIHDYLQRAARDEGLLPHLQTGAELERAEWDAPAGVWRLETAIGPCDARVLVLACGRLTESRLPHVPGVDAFHGPSFHSAQWRHDVDLTGLRVAVVGSGASAVQIVPALAGVARELVVLQRSAPYIVPRDDRAYTTAERTQWARFPDDLAAAREALFWTAEEAFAQRVGDPAAIGAARATALGHLAAQVRDPVLRAALTPDYEIGCKRVLISSDFYPALQRTNVRLVPHALAAVEPNAVIAADGSRHEVDAIVYATGFRTQDQPYARSVRGIGGETLAEHWADGMRSAATVAVPGFPNLFLLDGPNGGLGHNSAVFMIEAQIDHVLAALDHQEQHGDAPLEVAAAAEAAFQAELERMSEHTVWLSGGCSSWYVHPDSRRLTLLWPDFAYTFRGAAAFDPVAYREPTPSARGAEC